MSYWYKFLTKSFLYLNGIHDNIDRDKNFCQLSNIALYIILAVFLYRT